MTRPSCPDCGERTYRAGQQYGRQRFQCVACNRKFTHGRFDGAPPITIPAVASCIACRKLMTSGGLDRGVRRLHCRGCNVYVRAYRRPKNRKQSRQLQAAMLDAALLTMIRQCLPKNLPADIADDITQEMAVAALSGEFDLSDLAAHVHVYRTRINRLSSTTARFVSIDATVPGTNHLTYAETLIG